MKKIIDKVKEFFSEPHECRLFTAFDREGQTYQLDCKCGARFVRIEPWVKIFVDNPPRNFPQPKHKTR